MTFQMRETACTREPIYSDVLVMVEKGEQDTYQPYHLRSSSLGGYPHFLVSVS